MFAELMVDHHRPFPAWGFDPFRRSLCLCLSFTAQVWLLRFVSALIEDEVLQTKLLA
jgi:hypothetical protein